jgi:hypothetical protein
VISDTEITVKNPAHTPATIDVTVTTPAGTSATSAADHFTYKAPPPPPGPVVTNVNPTEGPEAGGTIVTIKGEHFTGATETKFGAANGTELKVISDTEITVKDPAHTPATIDVTVTTPAGTSATSTADHFTYKAATTSSPEVKLRDLLKEVNTSGIAHGIRRQLSCLLSDALRSLAGLRGYGNGPSKCGMALVSSRGATKVGRKSTRPGACNDLQQFVQVIKSDQRRGKPKIPAKLATAWSQAAEGIEASLGCTSHDKSHGHSSQHAHGRHRGHRSGGR